MQFAKDSFFLALQNRLAGLNPARVATINGATVPAIVVVENVPPLATQPEPNIFYVEWGEANLVDGHAGNNALMSMDVVISYYTFGSTQSMVDRGRMLAELDEELLGICQPPNTEKRDYTQSPSSDLGTSVFWTQPSFSEGKGAGMFWGRVSFPEREERGDDRRRNCAGLARGAEGENHDVLLFGGDGVMSTSPLRSAMVPITRQIRAYFAPVNRATESPTVFDPALCGRFPLSSPPAPWLDLGWIENFQRFDATPTDIVRAGAKGMPAVQFRGPLDARITFEFRQWGKLQMALACGSEHMNVLAAVAGSTAAASGGTPVPAVAVLPGSTAAQLILGAGAASNFAAGSLVAVDLDYRQQTGYVGSGIAAAYVSDPTMVNRDLNYVRRVTFNVARVAEVTADSLILGQPLLGGVPSGASVQAVVAFVDREGGSFFQKWSALFVAEEESGGRVCFYYPRLSADSGNASQANFAREEFATIAKPLSFVSLQAGFVALPYTDENDGQQVLCYRSYFPAAMAAVY